MSEYDEARRAAATAMARKLFPAQYAREEAVAARDGDGDGGWRGPTYAVDVIRAAAAAATSTLGRGERGERGERAGGGEGAAGGGGAAEETTTQPLGHGRRYGR